MSQTQIVNPYDAPEAHQVDPGGLLSELDAAPSAPETQPPEQVEDLVKKGDVVVSELTADETAYLRQIIRKQMAADQEAETARQFCEKHRADYLPTQKNGQVIFDILREMNAPFTAENAERAFQAALANDLLDMPTANSVSQAYAQDLIREKARITEAARRQAETDAERGTQSVRTGVPNFGVEPPSEEEEESSEAFAAKIAHLPLDQARTLMLQKMRAVRGETPNPRYRPL